MLCSMDIAILNKVNELAERFGIKPYEFIATVRNADSPTEQITLAYEAPPYNVEHRNAFDAMLDRLPFKGEDPVLDGTPEQVYEALDQAIRLAPTPRSRSNRK
jgi:hypothetical protein